jgi:enoyl-[acyl-carrier-protein] reductase (NADH)
MQGMDLAACLADPASAILEIDRRVSAALLSEQLPKQHFGVPLAGSLIAIAERSDKGDTAPTKGFFVQPQREGFQVAHDISSYSLAALAKAARPMMVGRPGAILAMSYLGAVRSVPSYNVMGLAKASLEANVRFLATDLGPQGIRVNAISAGPIKTLAAAGVSGFRKMLAHVASYTPLRRNVTIDEVGNAAAFLCSDLASGITGEVLYVDAGYSHVGMAFPEGDRG